MSYEEHNAALDNSYRIEPPARHSVNINAPQTPILLPKLPTGYPTGPTLAPFPVTPPGELPPTTLQNPIYTPGFLKTQIGKLMRVEFLMGSGPLVDRTGTLLEVGASYILLRQVGTDDVVMCDIYSIKFVTILAHAAQHL